jgi:protein-S-isoprenylcysteine O-methyltransferase Ste14
LAVAWILYAFSEPFPGKLWATVVFSLVVAEKVWSSCLRMPEKVAVTPQKDWTAFAVAFAYVAVLYATLAEIHLRREGFPSPAAAAIGASVFISGLVLRAMALRHLGAEWAIQLDRADAPYARLVRSGPYRYVRHPVYLGAMLEALGFALTFDATFGLTTALALFCPAEVARARFEERYLAARFGAEYAAYAEDVRGFVPCRRRH